MILFVVFWIVAFFISYKLKSAFGKFGFLRATFTGVLAWIIIFVLANLLKLDFNFLGFKADASKFKIDSLQNFLLGSLFIAIFAFILDLIFLYGAKFLDRLYEHLSNFFSKRE